MFDRNNVTAEQLQALNPEVGPQTIAEVHALTLRNSADRPFTYYDEEDAEGVWVLVVHTNTYGACASEEIMITTNEAAAIERLDTAEAHYSYDRGGLVVLVCNEDGIIDEDAHNAAAEILSDLESYPLLDEDGYCSQTWESAVESVGDAIQDEERDLRRRDPEMAQTLEDLHLEVDAVIEAALEEGEIEWHEEDCWPVFGCGEVEQALEAAVAVRRAEFALAATIAATCPRTLDLFDN